MKIKIGEFKNWWIGPYQIADSLKLIGVNDRKCGEIGDMLNATWLRGFCEWVYERNPFAKRTVKIQIDEWDTWNCDNTLALIIAPLLKQLLETSTSSSFIDDEDVPLHLRSTEVPPVEKYEVDENHHKRYKWALEEMLWAFDELNNSSESKFFIRNKTVDKKDSETAEELDPFFVEMKNFTYDKTGHDLHEARIDNGVRLFGKYFRTLWE